MAEAEWYLRLQNQKELPERLYEIGEITGRKDDNDNCNTLDLYYCIS